MVHVYQFETVGSVYIWQALRAQKTNGYSYGGPDQLAKDRKNGKRFSDYNREQQGQIAQDYYNRVLTSAPPENDPARLAFQPFIDDLQAGIL